MSTPSRPSIAIDRCIILFLLLCPQLIFAQPYWVRDLGGAGNEHIADIAIDTDGAIYVTGEFGGSVQFGGQSFSSAGGIDMFVARLDVNGQLVWFKQGGGSGIDKGLKIALGDDDVLAVTGEFMGTANLMGTTLTSEGGTADMYVAVLNKNDGSLQWIRQGGGATGTDRANGISIATDGTVSVAGEFRGTANWDGNSITSMIDPGTGQPGTDVFVASYSASGTLQWLKKGTAKFNDQGVDIVHDAGGNLYVTGQYSDTITFDQTHPNVIMNASFLVRFNSNGDEAWFRRFGGAGYNRVRDMTVAPDGKLLITGDVQGNMVWSGTTNVNVNSGDPFAYYILKVGDNGTLLQHTTMGSQNGVSVRGITASSDPIAVLGQFNCRFTGLCDHYGDQGIFMATGTEDLFIAKHTYSSLAIDEAQQFGGVSGKAAGGIAQMPTGSEVFTGSFQEDLIFPAVAGFQADISTFMGSLFGPPGILYCGDPAYGSYVASLSAGLTDGFVSRGYANGREPYDWWSRSGSACERPVLEPCIKGTGETACTDTLESCGPIGLSVDLKFPFSPSASVHHTGPDVTFQWSTGSTSATINANSTGTYWVTITSENGCWQWTDSIEVVILPLPPVPQVSDDVVINTTTSNPQPIELCHPQTQMVWGTNLDQAEEHWWNTPFNTNPLSVDSVQVDTTGQYTLVYTNSFGCASYTTVSVIDDPSVVMPDIDLDVLIGFPQDTDGNDSLAFCPGVPVQFLYQPTWLINGIEGIPPADLTITYGVSPSPPISPTLGGNQSGSVGAVESGWVIVDLTIRITNEPCGIDTLYFNFIDSIYVELYPAPMTSVSIVGPEALCDGDTALLVATCVDCDYMNWNGQGLIMISEDSVLVTNAGTYSVAAFVTNSYGCSFNATASVQLTTPTGPVLNVSPANGIICPDATATISTSVIGTDHIWYGPNGAILDEGAQLTTNVPGEYYLAMLVGGCPVTSNNVNLTNYGTPYLHVEPMATLCAPGDEITLQVVAAAGSQVQWSAPLSGSAMVQIVDQPGTYSVSVTACNITTPLSIDIISAPITAGLIDDGPFTICPGDTVLLQAIGGADDLLWLPDSSSAAELIVTHGATVTLIVQNDEGCSDTLDITIDEIGFPLPLVLTGDTVCAGDQAQLSASGSGNFAWYADAEGNILIGNGASISITANADTLLYVVQYDGVCMMPAEMVMVDVIPRPAPLTLIGPDELCAGEELIFTATGPPDVLVQWVTPDGSHSGNELIISEASTDHSGYYQITPMANGCNGSSTGQWLTVFDPFDLGLPSSVGLCTGGIVVLEVPEEFNDVQWSNGNSTHVITVIQGAEFNVNAIDPNGCAVLASVIVIEDECELIVPNVFTPNGDGINDGWGPEGGFVGVFARIYNRWGNKVYEGDLINKPWNGRHYTSSELCSDGVYFFEIEVKKVNGSSKMHTGYVHLQL